MNSIILRKFNNISALKLDEGFFQISGVVYFRGDFSILLWVKFNQFKEFSRIIDFGNTKYADNIIIFLDPKGQGYLRFGNFNYSSIDFITSNVTIRLDY